MIKFFRRLKRKKAFYKVMTLWYKVSMSNIDDKDLFDPRPKVGVVCYFIGSIDVLCQMMELDDSSFTKFSIEFFKDKNYYGFDLLAFLIIPNYFGRNHRIKFATESMKAGMDAFQAWYNSSFLSIEATEKLLKLIAGWNKKPDLGVDEVNLLVESDKG